MGILLTLVFFHFVVGILVTLGMMFIVRNERTIELKLIAITIGCGYFSFLFLGYFLWEEVLKDKEIKNIFYKEPKNDT